MRNAELIETLSAMYKPETSKHLQMEQHKSVKNTNAERPACHWKEEVKFDENYDEYKDEFNDLLSEFNKMWDGHIGRIVAVNHGVDLINLDVRPIHPAP